ncbi:hypothetical protein KGF57_003828 [Candida theae]|uniref:DUF218 domain-containing protein n=1 Tax=Candida theae TaxID=1198502 RepID=A0AAD5BCI3_9ASCO|nr:uncharacterized protein KGF57_003828 [Candida theae]KAI5954804.1 hypothetical protein KGF57_003828 [Candida theae]
MTCDINHLIIVPCHGIYKLGEPPTKQASWYLASFQLDGNDHLCFLDHIEQAVEQLQSDANSYLIVSGGETKREAGPISEALSYYTLAAAQIAKKKQIDVTDRITTENYARDSFENVIFSICRFYEVWQKYPTYITIIGFEFKRDRFLDLHLSQALGFPSDRVNYIGNSPNPNFTTKEETERYFEDLRSSEYANAVREFKADWYGVQSKLSSKRRKRNPFSRQAGYALSNPPLADFLVQLMVDPNTRTNEEIKELLKDAPWR